MQSKDHSNCLSIPLTCKSLQGTQFFGQCPRRFYRLIAYINLLPYLFYYCDDHFAVEVNCLVSIIYVPERKRERS